MQNINEYILLHNKPSTSMNEFQSNITNIESISPTSEFNKNNVYYSVNSDKCRINLDLKLYKKPKDHLIQDISFCEEVTEDDQDEIRKIQSRMNCSQFSNISVPNSFQSNYDNFTEELSNAKLEFYREASMLSELNSIGDNDFGKEILLDEQFITKFVLAEQICWFIFAFKFYFFNNFRNIFYLELNKINSIVNTNFFKLKKFNKIIIKI